MKTIWTALTILFLTANLSFAQEGATVKKSGFGFGARAAFDYGTLYGFSDENSDVDGNPSGIGFEIGLMGRITMIENLFFAPEVNIGYISTSHNYGNLERTYSSLDLEIPLLIRGVIMNKFYVTAGPQIAFNLSNDADIEENDLEFGTLPDELKEKVERETIDFGIAAGFGYNITDNLFIDARMYIGLKDRFAKGNDYSLVDMSGAKMMKFKVGLSYWFK